MEFDVEQLPLPTMTIEEFGKYLRREIRRGKVDPLAMLEAACVNLDLQEPEVLVTDILPERWLSKLLPVVWTRSTTFPSMWAGSDTWVRLFRRAGFVSNVPSLKRAPKDDLTIYRGTPDADRSAALRLSWTTDRDLAAWYAQRFNFLDHEKPTVWEASIPASGILAMFQEDGETEVVVNPRQLRSLTPDTIRRVPPTRRDEVMHELFVRSRYVAHAS